MSYDVLVAGAGPVGLSVALGLARGGRSVLVLEKEPGTSEHSRAPAIWPRTQEVLAGLGVLDRFFAEGIVVPVVELVDADRQRVLIRLPVEELRGETAHPHLLILPQSDTERLLLEALGRETSAEARFSVEVTAFSQTDSGVTVTCQSTDGSESLGHATWWAATARAARCARARALPSTASPMGSRPPWPTSASSRRRAICRFRA